MDLKTLLSHLTKERIPHNPDLIAKAESFARAAHEGQVRYTGEPYITHPLAVADILVSLRQAEPVIVAGILHDSADFGNKTIEQIRENFGEEVAFLVDGVSKVGKVQLRNKTDENFVENLRKMFVSMAKDIRVVIIRLADRLHNMQTLEAVPLSKQNRIAKETLEVYAPLAERLGMGHLKGTLEDLAFPYAYPDDHKWLNEIAKPHFEHAGKTTKRLIKSIKEKLAEHSIKAEVHGRPKRQYSLFKKLQRPEIERDIDKIHDLIALRVITSNAIDCYAALGIVHNHWKPVPQIGISDFIAQPKPNGYRSIHTKVFDHKGRIFEVQIRSEDMHVEAEFGAAAHYAYAEAKANGASDASLESGTAFSIDKKMDWIKQLASWQQQIADSEELIDTLKLDALSHRIYVFSPKGDVYDLPVDATSIDFAYAVHTDLLDYIQGAKVNGAVKSLNHPLKSGDVVEIIKTKNKRTPSRDWLSFVKTHRVKVRILRNLEGTKIDK
jgi:GTP diphosphokinase / guanosine-3',5'-bis(diphosphate) 3'-diphosphatase